MGSLSFQVAYDYSFPKLYDFMKQISLRKNVKVLTESSLSGIRSIKMW